MIEIAVDTNIIFCLYQCSVGNDEFFKGYSQENFLCLKCLDRILREDFYEPERRIVLKYVPSVNDEFLKGYQKDRECLDYARKYGEYCSLSKKENEAAKYLSELLTGKNGFYAQYKKTCFF